MTEFWPPPAKRPTVTYANCTVSAPTGFRPLHLDLHLPPGAGPFPVVLWVHGGGWQEGSRIALPDPVAPFGFHERLLARGYAVADVDYRLALEAPYPAQLIDVQSAIRWLRHHRRELRLDAGRFAALGESAGGHLAAMAGLVGEGDTAIQAVVNWYGVIDLVDPPGDPYPFTPPALLLGGPPAERRDLAAWASPLHRVHAAAPPFLNMHGTNDQLVPFEESVRLAEALRAQGVRCDLHPVPDADHCFVGCSDIGGLIEASVDFLDDVFKGH
ncbi:alpha/beta hydrolase [Micromonospora sp. WP24]|uniref:alpha/beta hydrolase n=1 Tax=Micromonospora sp. WP24 TaxID=2604469 RepID=UPI0011D2EBD5|nr:alpha/beta hydrolase [Micromonospora sp. WP24]TYB97865.1 alpha/beta hydrolase [Micromonospora sp. WP24]